MEKSQSWNFETYLTVHGATFRKSFFASFSCVLPFSDIPRTFEETSHLLSFIVRSFD